MRLITRANLDGVTCAALITTMEHIVQVIFANPRDIEDGTIEVKRGDAIANLPYHHNAVLWFDHHDKAEDAPVPHIQGKRGKAVSAARLVYEYYDSPRLKRFESLLGENDRISSAKLTLDDVLKPKDWVLLTYTVDPFMELDVFHDYANTVIAAIKDGLTIKQILAMPEVKGRVSRYLLDVEDFKEELQNITHMDGNVIVSDFRKVDLMPLGNRFLAFAQYREGNVQVRISSHEEKNKVKLRMGKSIFTRTCGIHLGRLAAEYAGGGLDGAAGCLLDPIDADEKIAEIIERLKERG